jgi:large subunit ribosomal protein L23
MNYPGMETMTMKLATNDIIIMPLITEKSTMSKDNFNHYVFKVHPKANKIMIKKACEELFDVKVDKVQIINKKGKTSTMRRRSGWMRGKKSDWKKAVIKLRADSKLEFFEGV